MQHEKNKSQPYPRFDFEQQQHNENSNFKDEPYYYHAKLVEVLASCTIGKEGLLQSENKLKALITFTYIMELLLEEDNLTKNEEQDDVIEK